MDALQTLRSKLAEQDRNLLTRIWEHYIPEGHWMPTRLLHSQVGSKQDVWPVLEHLGQAIVFRIDTTDAQLYGLTFLGVLLTTAGETLEALLARFLEFELTLATKEPLRTSVSSAEAASALNCSPLEVSALGRVLMISPFFAGGSITAQDWNARIPITIEDLPSDVLDHVRRAAIEQHKPASERSPRTGLVAFGDSTKRRTRSKQPAARSPVVLETPFATYTLSEPIGEGGTGRVYRATDDSGIFVAIKILEPTKATPERMKRFKNEISFGMRSPHPNIIRIRDQGFILKSRVKTPFYVMPIYPASLRELMRDHISTDRVIASWDQILDGVEAAHLMGAVHRDIKPENVLSDTRNGLLVLADFGIALFQEEDLYTTVETSPNTRLANFQYAAPEQRGRGQAVDRRADIFALGLVLNEMFTGQVPQGTQFKTIGEVAPEYAYLDQLVGLMLRQDPDQRPQSIRDIKGQLIARKNTFVTQQRISELSNTVIKESEVDDPLVADPPRVVNFDWSKGVLTLNLNRPLSSKWLDAFHNMGSFTSILGKEPERFRFEGDVATIPAEDIQVQAIIDSFKSWLPNANALYERNVIRDKQEQERISREVLQRELEEQQRRERLLKSVKL